MLVKSALKHLKPTLAYSGENQIPLAQAQNMLKEVLTYTTSEAERLWSTNQPILEPAILAAGAKRIPYKQRFYRNTGADSTLDPIDGALIGNLRELVEFKIISEAEAWIKNPNPYKQKFQFGRTLDLSATGDQYSTREYSAETNTVTLFLRGLDQSLTLVFLLPEYMSKRTISKLSKPRLRLAGDSVVFDFTIFETVEPKVGKLRAGVDLGKYEPYLAAVVDERGKRMADFKASRGLKDSWQKYYRLREQSRHLWTKIEAKRALGLDVSLLELEASRVRAKKTRLHAELSKRQASELAQKLSCLPVSMVNVEALAWLAGNKGNASRGGKWSYSRQQADLNHALERRGIRQKTVSPKNSSQKCYRCGTTIVYSSKTRTVQCLDCKTALDRDFNAAMNIATLHHLRTRDWIARFYGPGDSSCTTQVEVIAGVCRPKATVEINFAAQAANLVT